MTGLLFPEQESEFTEVAQRLGGAMKVAVVAHVKPDADAVGSACGLAAGLRAAGVEAEVFIGQPFSHPRNLDTVPGVAGIRYTDRLPETDLIVTVDCASADRTGAFMTAIAEQRDKVVVIDHHETNPRFGSVNLIVDAESTTMLVAELLRHMGVALDRDIAYCLYAGLVTDTGNFRWGTPRMHTLAAELMDHGLDTRAITLRLMDELSARDLQLLGAVLAGLEQHNAGGHQVAVLTIPTDALREMNQTAVEAVIDYARTLEGSDAGVVLKEVASRRWSVSLRSTAIDVSRVAQRLGGGGHIPAAGLSARGPRGEVLGRILTEIGRSHARA